MRLFLFVLNKANQKTRPQLEFLYQINNARHFSETIIHTQKFFPENLLVKNCNSCNEGTEPNPNSRTLTI